ncbi:MAG: V-type ATP synthase subunit D [Candidatus Omnitrophota bacterium]
MAKLKLTKNELKRQKDALEMFTRYLPTLMLKKQQLQVEVARIQAHMEEIERKVSELKSSVYRWVGVFAEDVKLDGIISVRKVHVLPGNIAGIEIPVFEKVDFNQKEYDLVMTPLWVDYAVGAIKDMIALESELNVLAQQMLVVKEELRITTQRVNLFEKVKIPETKDNIRRIRIFLGDLQTAAVVTGKVAKKKIQKKEETCVGA